MSSLSFVDRIANRYMESRLLRIPDVDSRAQVRQLLGACLNFVNAIRLIGFAAAGIALAIAWFVVPEVIPSAPPAARYLAMAAFALVLFLLCRSLLRLMYRSSLSAMYRTMMVSGIESTRLFTLLYEADPALVRRLAAFIPPLGKVFRRE
jgi:hypothetical protein